MGKTKEKIAKAILNSKNDLEIAMNGALINDNIHLFIKLNSIYQSKFKTQ